jgi:ribonuclease E
VLRSLEDRLITDGVVPLVATTAVDVALYILNQKRSHLKDIEQRYRIPITVTADENLHVSQFVIERSAESEIGTGESAVVQMDWAHHQQSPAAAAPAEGDSEQVRRRSRRRRRKRRGPGEAEFEPAETATAFAETADADEEEETEREPAPREAREPREPREPREAQSSENGGQTRKPRRRGRRGGRRGRGGQRPESGERQGEMRAAPPEAREAADAVRPEGEPRAQQNGGGRPAPAAASHEEKAELPPRESEPSYAAPVSERSVAAPEIKVESEIKEDNAPPRRGWWQR